MDYFIGVDAGGTKTSASSYDEEKKKMNEVKYGPGNISVNWSDALININNSIDDLIKLESNNHLKGIGIGIAGLPSNKKKDVQVLFSDKYHMPVIIESDYMMAFNSTFNQDNGILVIAGTGVVIFGSYEGKTVKLGGWGHLLGDEGSGYDIVIRTIKHAISVFEEENKLADVMAVLIASFGCNDFEGAKRYIYAHEKSEIGRHAPLIVERAKDGDSFSVAIINEVVDIIYSKINLISNKLGVRGTIELSTMGGVLNADSYILELLIEKTKLESNHFKYIPAKDPGAAVVDLIANQEKSNTPSQYAVGLMSGTSLDGIDAVLCEIDGYDFDTDIAVVDFETYGYNMEVLKKVEKVVRGEEVMLSVISELNVELGYEYAEAAKKICIKNNIKPDQLAFIASHGQTVFHDARGSGRNKRSTLQLGEPSVIAYETGSKVISNFRTKDMAANGEGAPLVPKSERIIYRSNKDTVFLNIGGISNLTYLPEKEVGKVYGYDTGPGNMMINEAVHYFFDVKYDDKGKIAAKGRLIKPLSSKLMCHWFISKTPPKSTGRDEFGKEYTLSLIQEFSDEKPEDIVFTLTAFTAYSIAKHVKEISQIENVDRLIISGGGTYNLTLLKLIKESLSNMLMEVKTQEDIGYSSDAKEAVAFVILGNQTLHQRPGNIPSVTGADKEVILGSVTYPT